MTAECAVPENEGTDQVATDDDCRDVASDWHGGQGSALYAYASTGTIKSGIVQEIDACIRGIEKDPDDYMDAELQLRYLNDLRKRVTRGLDEEE